MKIIKRDGSIVDYNPEKIRIAIKKANNEVSKKERATETEIDEIITYIEDMKKSRILVEDIQDIIEQKLMALEKYQLAKTYLGSTFGSLTLNIDILPLEFQLFLIFIEP